MRRSAPSAWILLILALCTGAAPRAVAQDCVTSLPDDEVRERTTFIEERLDDATPAARAWYGTWLATNITAASAQLTLAFASRGSGARKDAAVAAAGPSLGTALLVFRPLSSAFASRRLRHVRATTDRGRFLRLRLAEALLRRGARRQRFERSWFPHLASLAFASMTSVFLWQVFDRPRSALISFIGNLAGAEVRIWTVPRAAIRDWAEYERRYGAPLCTERELPGRRPRAPELPAQAAAVSVEIVASPLGVGMTLRF